MSQLSVIIISEHPYGRLGLAAIVGEAVPTAKIMEAKSIDHMLEIQGEGGSARLVFLDTSMQFGRELEAVQRLREIGDIDAIMVLEGNDHPGIIRQYLDIGVQGVVPKTTELSVLANAVRLVLSGARYVPETILNPETTSISESKQGLREGMRNTLTDRQMDILNELGSGASNKEIGTQLGISVSTVKLHVNAILKKLGVQNRTQAAIIAYSAGITSLGKRPFKS